MSSGMRLDANDVGGADVVRMFTLGGVQRKRGERLTRDEVLSIPVRNREALVSSQVIREFPRGVAVAPTEGELFVCRRADGRYDVVRGVRVNPLPLVRAEAERLAAGEPIEGEAVSA